MHRGDAPVAGTVYEWVGLSGEEDSGIRSVRIDSTTTIGMFNISFDTDNGRTISTIRMADFVAAVDLGILVKRQMIKVGDLRSGDRIGTGQKISEVMFIDRTKDEMVRVFFTGNDPIDYFHPDVEVVLHSRATGQIVPVPDVG